MKKYLVTREYLINRGEGFETDSEGNHLKTFRKLNFAKMYILNECDSLLTYKELNKLEEKKIEVLTISFFEDDEPYNIDELLKGIE